MEIKLAESAEEIIKLMKLEGDGIEEDIAGDRGDLIQWLVQENQRDPRKVFVWIVYDEDTPKGYAIIIDNRLPPLTNDFLLFYTYAPFGLAENKKLFKTILDWVSKQKGKRIVANTTTPSVLARYGFQPDGYTSMSLDLED